MTFHSSIYKLIETEKSQIYRFANQPAPIPRKMNKNRQIEGLDLECKKCGNIVKIQINIGKKTALAERFYRISAK